MTRREVKNISKQMSKTDGQMYKRRVKKLILLKVASVSQGCTFPTEELYNSWYFGRINYRKLYFFANSNV